MKNLQQILKRIGPTYSRIFITLLLWSAGMQLFAQCDFTEARYAVREELDVLYGIQNDWAGNPDSLRLDLYKPSGDHSTARPLLMLVHGGGFASGDKSELKALCTSIASCGIVCVSLEYRLGFVRPLQLDYPYSYDQAEVYRAIYRAQQDAKGAIRFLKGRSDLDSTDRNEFYTGGFSAGGFVALATAFYTDSSLRFPSTLAISDAVNQSGTYARPDLGLFDGGLHRNGENATIKGVFNFFGAVHDTSIITSSGPKIWQYHQSGDPVVPCERNKPYHGIGLLIPDNYPAVSGSCHIQTRLQNLGAQAPEHKTIIHNGNEHDVHDIVSVQKDMLETLSKWICSGPLSATAIQNNLTAKVYPNPSKTRVMFEQIPSGSQIEIFDHQGRLCAEMTSNASILEWKHQLPDGIYCALIATPDGGCKRFSFIVSN